MPDNILGKASALSKFVADFIIEETAKFEREHLVYVSADDGESETDSLKQIHGRRYLGPPLQRYQPRATFSILGRA